MTISSLSNITVTGSDLKKIKPDLSRYLSDDINYTDIIEFEKTSLQQTILDKEHSLQPTLANDDLNTLVATITDTTENYIKHIIIYNSISTILRSGAVNSPNIVKLADYYKDKADNTPLRYKIGSAQVNKFLSDSGPSFQR